MTGPVEIAREAWGAAMPDWVARLAAECAAASQSKVAAQLNRSATLVSQVLRAKYPGDLAAVEDVVRGVFEGRVVECPQLGTIPANDCQDWRRKSLKFQPINALRVDMYRACHRCPRNKKDMDDDR